MPVNPDEILIFKMRGMKKRESKQPEAKKETVAKPMPEALPPAAEEVTPEEVPIPPTPQPVPTPAPVEEEKVAAAPAVEAQPAPKEKPKREVRFPGLFVKKEKPLQAKVKEAPTPVEKTLIESFQAPEAPQPVEEERLLEVEKLERQAFEYVPEETEQEVAEARAVLGPNPFAILAGTILITNSILFGYFIYPQASFVLGYAAQIGFRTFITNLNFNYGFTFLNFLLVVFSALAGLLMFSGARWSNMISGAVGAVTLLAVTFEFLNSNAEYLLVVSVIAFVGIFALAYSRMSAVSAEKEEIMPREMIWPKLETF